MKSDPAKGLRQVQILLMPWESMGKYNDRMLLCPLCQVETAQQPSLGTGDPRADQAGTGGRTICIQI